MVEFIFETTQQLPNSLFLGKDGKYILVKMKNFNKPQEHINNPHFSNKWRITMYDKYNNLVKLSNFVYPGYGDLIHANELEII